MYYVMIMRPLQNDAARSDPDRGLLKKPPTGYTYLHGYVMDTLNRLRHQRSF